MHLFPSPLPHTLTSFIFAYQLSTRSKDYVIDTLLLRAEMHRLLDVFSDPNVVKVFHGCDHDVEWLQRDFGLFVVNCFDTHQAAKLLGFPALSLAHLLKFYCAVTANKKYQLADWRQRPIPKEMLHYAREDTHYLLHIYDCLRRDVLNSHDKTGLCAVFEASKRICLKKYEKEMFSPSGYMKLLSSNRVGASLAARGLNATQDCVLAAVWNWRDRLARQLDESPSYIMTNSELLKFGVRFKDFLPTSESELASCVPNMGDIARLHLNELLREIELNANGQSMIESSPKQSQAAAEGSKAANVLARKNGKTLVNVRGSASGALSRLLIMQNDEIAFEPIAKSSAQAVTVRSSDKPSVPPLGNGKHSSLNRGTPSPGEASDVGEITEVGVCAT
jgi:ribonuclease D